VHKKFSLNKVLNEYYMLNKLVLLDYLGFDLGVVYNHGNVLSLFKYGSGKA